jgi:hypothetical protein
MTSDDSDRLLPEQRVRVRIDAMLEAAAWVVVVADFGRWVPTLNGHRIHVKPPLVDDPRVDRLR